MRVCNHACIVLGTKYFACKMKIMLCIHNEYLSSQRGQNPRTLAKSASQ